MDRYTVTSRTGQAVVRTNSLREATRYRHVLQGSIIDHEETVEDADDTVTAELVMN